MESSGGRVRAVSRMSEPVKVLVVIGQLDVGGTELHLAQVMPALLSHGIIVEVFTLKPGGAVAATLREKGVLVLDVPSRRAGLSGLLQAGFALARVIRSRRPSIIHFFLPAAYLVGFIPALTHAHALRVMSRRSLNTYQRRYPGIRLLEMIFHRGLDAALGNSRAVTAQLRDEGIDPRSIGLIYNGIGPQWLQASPRSDARAGLGIEPYTVVFVTVANLIAYKGHEDILKAFALARMRLSKHWIWLCVGRDDGIGERLRERASALGVQEHCRWLGGVSDVERYLRAADIGVYASHEEGFSNALLETMASRLPVVATAVGGNIDAVIDGVTGFLVPHSSPAALAEALARLASDGTLRRTMGAAGHSRVVERFTSARCVSLYAALYRGLSRDDRKRPIPEEVRANVDANNPMSTMSR